MSFARACAVGDVEPGTALAVTVDDVAVAVVRDGDEWYAIYDECSHAAVALSEGDGAAFGTAAEVTLLEEPQASAGAVEASSFAVDAYEVRTFRFPRN